MTFSQNRFVVGGGGDGGGGGGGGGAGAGGVFRRCSRRHRNEHVTLAAGVSWLSCGYAVL